MAENKFQRSPLMVVVILALVIGGIVEFGFRGLTIAYAKEAPTFNVKKEEGNLELGQITTFYVDVYENNLLTIEYPPSFDFDENQIKETNQARIKQIVANQEKKQIEIQLNPDSDDAISISGSFNKEGEHELSVHSEEQIEILTYRVGPENSVPKEQQSSASNTTAEKDQTTTSVTEEEMFPSIDEAGTFDLPKVAIPTDFDFRKLDPDGIDLSSFTRVYKNTPVKLTGGAFDEYQRTYYMFFGHVGKQVTYSGNDFTTGGNMYRPLGKELKVPLSAPVMIGVDKEKAATKAQVFSYDFYYGQNTAGASSSLFDLGQLDAAGAIAIRSATPGSTESVTQVPTAYIMEQYVKDNEIISYGYIGRTKIAQSEAIDYQPVRVHGRVVDFDSGRISYDYSYYNHTGEAQTFAMQHGTHVDIGGAHQKSKLYSNGSSGIYYDEPDGTPADGIPARVYFWMGHERGPTAFNVGNMHTGGGPPLGWRGFTLNGTWKSGPLKGYKAPYEPWLGIGTPGELYALSHPINVFRWDPVTIKAGEVATNSFEMSLGEPTEHAVPRAKKTYNNLTATDGKNSVSDTIEFALSAKNAGDVKSWNQVTIKDQIPEGLDVITSSFRLVDENGTEASLPASIYNPNNRMLQTGPYDIPAQKQITIKFQANITGSGGKNIKNRMTASNPSNESAEAEVEFFVEEQPEQPGVLEFVSAPSLLDFGQNLKIAVVDRTYPIQIQQGEKLVIKDTRGPSHNWSMTATLLKELTSTSGAILKEGLHYRSDNSDLPFLLNTAILIASHETTDDGPVDLSSMWSGTDKGPVLVIPAGSVVPETYSADIRWTLQDVPSNG